MKPFYHHPFAPRAAERRARGLGQRAFSLVEVTLALGIVTFAMVGVVGVMPTALTTGRQSFDQNRAATIANTLFTSFRSQPFASVGYLDEQFDENGASMDGGAVAKLDLNKLTSQSSTDTKDDVKFYAWFIDTATEAGADTFGQQRHLCFASTQPAGGTRYAVTLHFNNHPDGMVVVPDATTTPPLPAQANQIEMSISPLAHPVDKYQFISTVANRF